jgi:catechol 2,3-dioxygenase-like lactoylglutathione lyase family enzyme
MKTLFVAYRVTDLDRSLDFYTALGYIEVGSVAGGDGGRLALLKSLRLARPTSSSTPARLGPGT